jgi:diguanylate cyclase (GGDEF)-like protein
MPHAAALRTLASRWRRLWSLDDAAVLDAGAGAERIIAMIRLALTTLLLAIPMRTVLVGEGDGEAYVGLGVASVAVVLAVVMLIVSRRGTMSRRLGFASGVIDVSMVSTALAAYLVLDAPHTAVNSKVVFEVYFLAIGATCLRYDWRACVASGTTAIAQYAAIVVYADATWALNAERYAPFPYGMFSWTAQLSRLVVLFIATVLSTTIVLRARTLRHLSTRDRLTGLYNRGYFDERLAQEMSRARRTGEPLAVAVLDVDHFKWFNDSHGHQAGDAALRAVADVLRAGVRASDVVARYGGEEMVLLLPGTTPEAAAEKLDGLRQAIAALEVPLPRASIPGRLTASVGIGTWPVDGDEGDEVVYQADRRLFVAKELGRNRVVGRILPPALGFGSEDDRGEEPEGGRNISAAG